jgi:antitoxin HicB
MRTIEFDPRYLECARRYATTVAAGEEADCPFVASAAEFPYTVGVGDTPEEALEVLLGLIAATVQTLELDGAPMPEPLSAYSGLLHLRVPKRLHQALAAEARADGVSLNAAATALLAAGLGMAWTPQRRGRCLAGAAEVARQPA